MHIPAAAVTFGEYGGKHGIRDGRIFRMLLKRKVDIETAKADTEGVNFLHKTAQNKSADRYITKSDSSICTVFAL